MTKNKQKLTLDWPHRHLLRYSLTLAKSLGTPSLIYLIVVGNGLLITCAYIFFHFEQPKNPHIAHFGDALWWAFSTVTTVGYGDIVPHTDIGRVVGVILMLSGTVAFFGFTAILISVFSSLTAEEVKETEALTKAEYEEVIQHLKRLEDKIDRHIKN